MVSLCSKCRMFSVSFAIFVGVFVCAFENTLGQHDDSPRIYSLHIRSKIQFRFATTLVTSRVVNPSNYTQETKFEVTLPEQAFISNFTLEIDGEIYPGIVKDKDEARKDYEQAKKKGRTTGLVSKTPRDARKFKVEIAIAAQGKVTFNLTYQELLKRVIGVYEHRIFVNPGHPVKDLKITVSIYESRDITKLFVPPIRNLQGLLTNDYKDGTENALAVIERLSPRQAFINYSPGLYDQGDTGISGQFVVQYDVDRSLDGGDVLVVNGYFVHFLAPDIKTYIPKDILFVLDVSGSMSGRKIEQLQEAMYSILPTLQEGDRFNIIKFSYHVSAFRHHMVDVSKGTVFEAMEYVKKLHANGGTNINEGILDAVKRLMNEKEEDERSPIIVFLTDGIPTVGVTKDTKILQNIQRRSEGTIPLFSLAFGVDADWNLVKKMAIQNNGVARKIYEDSDASLQISGFYEELQATLLNNVSVKYLGGSVDEDSVTKSEFKNYFRGSELIVAGRLADTGVSTVDLKIVGNTANGTLILNDDQGVNIIDLSDIDGPTDLMDFERITEKMWAYLTIKQLLERAEGEPNATAVQEMKDRAKELALKHGFVTPQTSMVVVQPELDDEVLANTRPTTTPPPTTTTYRPYRGGYSGGYGGGGGGDPHFIVRFRDIEHPLCFDFPSKAKEVVNLITDPRKHVTINTEMIGGEEGKHGQKTYMGKIAILMAHHVIMVTPEAIVFDTRVHTWYQERVIHFGGHKFKLSDRGQLLTVQFSFGPEVLIRRHTHNKGPKVGLNYLNVYVKHEDGFSTMTTGLIGQFVNGHKHISLRNMFTTQTGKQMAKFTVKERSGLVQNDLQSPPDNRSISHRIVANLVPRKEILETKTEMCWMVHKKFEKTFLGDRNLLLRDELFTN